jgi:hypothetical protein
MKFERTQFGRRVLIALAIEPTCSNTVKIDFPNQLEQGWE